MSVGASDPPFLQNVNIEGMDGIAIMQISTDDDANVEGMNGIVILQTSYP